MSSVYPLTAFDSTFSIVGVTYSYVLTKSKGAPYDTTPLVNAIEKVAQKWPFLAARIVRDKHSGLFHVSVPSVPPSQPAVKFTVSTYNTTLPSSAKIPVSTGILNERPPLKYFRHPSTPYRAATYAATGHPLISIHVSHLLDATCIGFAVPHGVFDAIGLGQVLRAMSDELAGREWTPPPQPTSNIFSDAISALPSIEKEPEALVHYKKELTRLSFWLMLKFMAKVVYERAWCRVATKALYLDQATVERLVTSAKQEAKANGGWVSTGDILLAWFVKAALSDEPARPNPVIISTFVSFRTVLAERAPSVMSYPHNAIAGCPTRLYSNPEVFKLSITELAMQHRAHVNSARTPEMVSGIAEHLGPASTMGSKFPNFQMNKTMLAFTNQVAADLTSMDFGDGTKVVGFWESFQGVEPDHLVCINKLQGGYIFMGGLRESRWRAIDKAVAQLQRQGMEGYSP